MRSALIASSVLGSLLFLACGGGAPQPVTPQKKPPPARTFADDEVHLGDVKQLTAGGENAEAYWSWSGNQLILQARGGLAGEGQQCDRIFRIDVANPNKFVPVSSGKGATTCSFFLPGDQDVIYASTHLGGDACPPKPDHSKGYVWALYDSYDIFRAKADGTGVTRLTDAPGYDAEATVCKKDGSIVFTSVRDGDIELYRMDADGKNQKRLTNFVGYDGGAFFNEDCTKLVWRASRPKPGKEEEEFKALLKQGLVRPTKLEIWVANADGSEPMQITYMDAASFGPYFFPGGKRVIFSSNYGDPKGREFDLWAVNIDGTALERVTFAPGFDGFPMFSPDGKQLVFASNRATKPGAHDTNLFLAKWVEGKNLTIPSAADRIAQDDTWLASPEREGRGVGTKGLNDAALYLEKRFVDLGLEPVGKTFRQTFDVTTSLTGSAKLAVGGKDVADLKPLAFSTSGKPLEAPLVFANYGITTDNWDDYKGLDVKDKIVVVRRFTPEGAPFDTADARKRHGDLRHKAWVAREKGAKGIVVVDLPAKPAKAPADWKMPDDAKVPPLVAEGAGDAGILAAIAPRASFAPIVERLLKKEAIKAKLEVSLLGQTAQAYNIVGKWPAQVPEEQKLRGPIVIGAHYDHLGFGGHRSLTPDKHEVHPGADDNGSGTATLLEIARMIGGGKMKLRRDVIFASFSGEELGTLGSSAFVKDPLPGAGPADVFAMINMDMVGRVRENKLDVIGWDTADEWPAMFDTACDAAHIDCAHAKGGGYGPSDHSPFYGAGVPVLHLFSGTQHDYHRPSDTADKINAAGMAQVAKVVVGTVQSLALREAKLTYKQVASPPPQGDTRSFGASLGTVPDYAPPKGTVGVLLSGVRPGGAAEKAGMQRGDVLVKIGKHEIKAVEDLMYVLSESKPGEKTKATVLRDGKPVELEVTFGASTGIR